MNQVETIESIRHANMQKAENARKRRIEELSKPAIQIAELTPSMFGKKGQRLWLL